MGNTLVPVVSDDKLRVLGEAAQHYDQVIRLNNQEHLALDNHLARIHQARDQSSDIDWWSLPPLIPSLLIGGISGLPYWNLAQKAAPLGSFKSQMYGLTSLIYNAMLGAYFAAKELGIWWGFFRDAITTQSKEKKRAEEAADYLAFYHFTSWDYALRKSQEIAEFLLTIGLAFISGIPMFVIDMKNSDHPLWISSSVYIAFSFLCLAGIKEMIEISKKVVSWSLSAMHRAISSDYQEVYKIEQRIKNLHKAHIKTIESAQNKIRDLIQRGDTQQLQPLYALMDSNKKTQQDSLEFYLTYLQFAEEKFYKDDPTIAKRFIQVLSIAVTFAASAGYYFDTVAGVATFSNTLLGISLVGNTYWMVGTLFFVGFFVLSLKVSWDISAQLYDFIATLLSGLYNHYDQINSVEKFFNLENWADIIPVSVSMKQNPILTIVPFIVGLVLSYWTAGSSLYLNQLTLGNTIAEWLIWPTVFVTMTFNSQPLGPFLDGIQRFCTKLFGSAREQQELNLVEIGEQLKSDAKNMTDIRFLEFAKDLSDPSVPATMNRLEENKKSQVISGLFGNRDVSEVLKNDEQFSANQNKAGIQHSMQEVIRVTHTQYKEKRSCGFFSHTKNDATDDIPLLPRLAVV